jgi:hypothetical protein
MPKKSKKSKREEEEEEEELAMPVDDDEAPANAEARKAKKQKKKVEAAAEPPSNEAADDDKDSDDAGEEAGGDEVDPEKARLKLRRRREHKKVSGYRNKAVECGFTPKAGVVAASGLDCFASALSPADAKRLMRFVPEVLNKSTYDKAECVARMKLSTESVPESAARETVARCETVMRKFLNEAVLRAVEKGTARVDAATMQSVLRPYQYLMTFSSVLPPKGLIRHAQESGVISASVADSEGIDQEKSDNRELVAAAKKIDKAEEERKAAFQERKKKLAEDRAHAAKAAKA